MAAGLGFKDFVTGEVLTAADVDGYLMQGVWVFASAAARDAAVTSPQEGNFAYLKDTNVTTYYTGSAWANLDTTGMTNPMTTTGDTIYSSSGSTPARLGIGTANQVLRVNSGATAPEWATVSSGSMTLITRNAFTASSTLSVDSLFSDTYENYLVTISCISSVNSDLYMRARYSATDETGSHYSYGWAGVEASGGAVAIAGSLQDKMQLNVTSGTSDNPILSTLTFFRSSGSKQLVLSGSAYNYRQERGYGGGGVVKVAQTWTGLSFFTSSGTITGTLSVYGLAK